MLSCREVAERASALIDGEVRGWEAIQIRMHLAMCKGCQRFIRQMRLTRDLTLAAARSDARREDDDARIDAILSELHKGQSSQG
jgi:hypothetical protein